MSDLVIFHCRQFPACRLLPGGYFGILSCMSVPDLPNATSDTILTPPPPRVILLMGVSGCGKSRIGELLASGLKGRFVDADDLHPPANKAKMSAKIPLTDEDREVLSRPGIERQARLNALLFPGPTAEFEAHRAEYGDTSQLSANQFFYGLRQGEEHRVRIDKGVELLIGLEAISEPDEKGKTCRPGRPWFARAALKHP